MSQLKEVFSQAVGQIGERISGIFGFKEEEILPSDGEIVDAWSIYQFHSDRARKYPGGLLHDLKLISRGQLFDKMQARGWTILELRKGTCIDRDGNEVDPSSVEAGQVLTGSRLYKMYLSNLDEIAGQEA